MRYFERWDGEGETSRAYECFSVYRDLGPSRSLAKCAEVLFGESSGKVRQLEKWSSRFSWVSRAASYDDWREHERRIAVEEHEARVAEEFEERRRKLREQQVESAERAVRVVDKMLSWPLVRKEVVEWDESGNPVRVEVHPSRWTMASIPKLMEMIRRVSGEPEVHELRARLEHSGTFLTNEDRAVLDEMGRNEASAEVSELFRRLFEEPDDE